MITNQNILITGGFGLIGSNLIKSLLNKKFNLIIIDSLIDKTEKNINVFRNFIKKNKIIFYQTDLKNFEKVRKVFEKHSIHCIIHLAAISSILAAIKHPKKVLSNNVKSTKNLIDLTKRYKVDYFIFSSSASVYGNIKFKNSIKENSKTKPLNAYAKSKINCEKLIIKNSRKNNYKFCILRYFNVVGKNPIVNENKKYMNLFEKINLSINSNKIFKVHGKNLNTYDGTPVRDYIYIDDLVSAHLICLNKVSSKFWNNIYNIGYNNGISVLEIIKETQRIYKNKLKYKFINIDNSTIIKSIADNSKFLKVADWRPKFSSTKKIVKNYFLK